MIIYENWFRHAAYCCVCAFNILLAGRVRERLEKFANTVLSLVVYTTAGLICTHLPFHGCVYANVCRAYRRCEIVACRFLLRNAQVSEPRCVDRPNVNHWCLVDWWF